MTITKKQKERKLPEIATREKAETMKVVKNGLITGATTAIAAGIVNILLDVISARVETAVEKACQKGGEADEKLC